MRSGLIVGVLLLVFVVILPRYIDYSEVLAAFQALTIEQIVVITILGIVGWIVSGLVFCALIPGLSIVRGFMSWLILSGIGSSVPFGPWNMGVLWVVVRGWGVSNLAATSGIALYGIVNELSRLFLPLFAIGALALSGQLAGKSEADTAWTIAIISAVAFVVATGLIIAVVRSERVADWLGRTGQRAATWVMTQAGPGHGTGRQRRHPPVPRPARRRHPSPGPGRPGRSRPLAVRLGDRPRRRAAG